MNTKLLILGDTAFPLKDLPATEQPTFEDQDVTIRADERGRYDELSDPILFILLRAMRQPDWRSASTLVYMLDCEQRDAAIMVARTIAHSGRKDGYAQSCADFVTKHTGLKP